MSYRYVLTQMLEASASAMYRYEDDSLAGVTQGVDLTTALEWKLGYFDQLREANKLIVTINHFYLWLSRPRDSLIRHPPVIWMSFWAQPNTKEKHVD